MFPNDKVNLENAKYDEIEMKFLLSDLPVCECSRMSTIISWIYSKIFRQIITGFLIKSNDVRNERARVGAIYSTNNIR
jgi:hypothetical protein